MPKSDVNRLIWKAKQSNTNKILPEQKMDNPAETIYTLRPMQIRSFRCYSQPKDATSSNSSPDINLTTASTQFINSITPSISPIMKTSQVTQTAITTPPTARTTAEITSPTITTTTTTKKTTTTRTTLSTSSGYENFRHFKQSIAFACIALYFVFAF